MLSTQVKNDNEYKRRQLEAGNKRITLMAPVKFHEELKQIAATMREEAKGHGGE